MIVIMRVHIGENKPVTTIEPKNVHFDLPQDVDNNLKHETDSIIKQNEFSAGHKIKNEIDNYCSNISMETIFMNTESSKTSEQQKFALNLSQRLDLRHSNKHVAL